MAYVNAPEHCIFVSTMPFSLGALTKIHFDHNLYFTHIGTNIIVLIVYVDDIFWTNNSPHFII